MGAKVLGLRAIIYVPTVDRERWAAACFAYCQRHGHEVVALVVDGPGRWDQVFTMFAAGEADIVVVGSSDHPPADRLPRIESVTEELPRFGSDPGQRRTRVIRRDGGA
jgi:hypothetical protein